MSHFFFNTKENPNGDVLIHNGTATKHTHIMLTSKKLMLNAEKKGVFHLDATYKLIKNGFPLIVFGVSDIQGSFHPIAFCVTSNEEASDFYEFYSGIIGKNLVIAFGYYYCLNFIDYSDLSAELGLIFEPEFIMQDSWPASYNAAREVGLNSEILMCYFHVIFNISKRYKNKMSSDKWDQLLGYLKTIHMSRNVVERNENWLCFQAKYKVKKPAKDDLYTYISTHWYDSRWNKWMIYHSPPGYANTNSNIESFNATIKRDFFFRKRLSVIGAVSKIEEIIRYYSIEEKSLFHIYPKFKEDMGSP